MTSDRSAQEHANSTDSAWTRFWFTPAQTLPLRALRVLSGLLFFCWLASFLGHQVELFSMSGWIDLEAFRTVPWKHNAQGIENPQSASPVGWSMLHLAGENVALFQAMYFGSLFVLALFTFGIATRITGVLTWVIVVSFLANPAVLYDGDFLLVILAFYLMIGHLFVGQWNGNLTLVERIIGSRNDFVLAPWLFPKHEQPPSIAANFTLRLLQIHFAIIIATSALHKLQISDWWTGVIFWYPLHPTFKTTLESLQREAPRADVTLFYLSLAAYAVLAWQLSFPMFAWRRGWWRGLLLGGAAIGWIGSYFLFGLPLFGPFVVIGCLSYLGADEWAWMTKRIGSMKLASPTAELKEPAAVGKTHSKK